MRIESPSSLPPRHLFEFKSALPFVGVLSSGKELIGVSFLKLTLNTTTFTLKK
jgi:hypothetical protein